MDSTNFNQEQGLQSLLHKCDDLNLRFNRSHLSQLNSIEQIWSSILQIRNLRALAAHQSSRPSSSGNLFSNSDFRTRTMVRLGENVESCLNQVRDELLVMERISEEQQSLIFQIDLLLSNPTTALSYGLNPAETAKRIGSSVDGCREELLRRRELLADFPGYEEGEDEGMEDWMNGWKEAIEIKRGEEQELGDLADLLGSWSGAGSAQADDTEMG